MTALPVIERELRVALRKHKPARRRLRFAAACAGGIALFLLLSGMTENRTAGRDVHQILCLVGLFIVLRAPQFASVAFAQDRRDQTLGLLLLTGFIAGDVLIHIFLCNES